MKFRERPGRLGMGSCEQYWVGRAHGQALGLGFNDSEELLMERHGQKNHPFYLFFGKGTVCVCYLICGLPLIC